MGVKGWDPFQDLNELQERMNRLFEESISRTRSVEDGLLTGAWSPSVDIYETEGGLVLIAELPGVVKEDIHIDIKENVLVLKGDRKRDASVKEENYYRMESYYGQFSRTFTFPYSVESEKIIASLKDGLLEIRLPRLREKEAKAITVEIE